MDSSEFVNRLSFHVDAGRLDSKSFESIKSFEEQQPISQVFGNISGVESSQAPVAEASTVGHEEASNFNLTDHAMRIALGSAAATGATMILFGVGFLSLLISDNFESIHDAEEWLMSIGFGLLAIASWVSFRRQYSGKAEIFLNEARIIIFSVSALMAWVMFVEGPGGRDSYGDFGPFNSGLWLPLLALAIYSAQKAREMDARVTYTATWILGAFPFFYALAAQDDTAAFLSAALVLGALLRELFMEWDDVNRKPSMAVQATFNAFAAAVCAWFLVESFDEAFTFFGEEMAWLIYFSFHLAAWMILMEVIPRQFGSKTYSGTSTNKAWPGVMAVMVFYTGMPLALGFSITDFFDIHSVDFLFGDFELAWLIAFIIHGVMGLQMFGWKFDAMSMKTSLTEPSSFTGGVFFVMAFIWFLILISDWLEDNAVFVFLPLGIFILVMGTKKLIEAGESNEISKAEHQTNMILEEA
jgi:hypothetical protein